MEEFRFKEWKVYKDSQFVFSEVLHLVQKLPKEYRYTLGDQLIRSSFSIVLNIAEGSGKASEGELGRYLNISMGSSYESIAALDTLAQNNFLEKPAHKALEGKLIEMCRQLGGLKKRMGVKK